MSVFNTFTLNENNEYVYKEYDGNNIIAGDTDSVILNISKVFSINNSLEERVQFSDELGEIVNESFPDFMKSVFNVPEERSGLIQTEREVYGDKGYFGSKKRYMVHIIDEEGKKVDKHKIKGLEIIKSDTNDNLRVFLKKLVMMFLQDKSRGEILEEVERFKEWWYQGSILDIGTPKSVKVLADYMNRYEHTGSLKHMPQHVKASIFYNKIKDNKAPPIRSGDKITICYIKDNKESNIIAVPSDLDEVPSCLNNIVIDYDTQWEKVGKKKIDNYLQPVGLDFESYRKNHTRKLFDFG